MAAARARALLRAVALAGCAACVAAAPPAGAATASGKTVTITLIGTMRANCAVQTNMNSQASSIDLTVSQTNYAVATLFETCTSPNGYRVTAVSQNGSSLGQGTPVLLGAAHGNAIPYTLLYNGTPVTFSGGTAVVADISGKAISVPKQVAITFTANPAFQADSYSDTLTFAIVGK